MAFEKQEKEPKQNIMAFREYARASINIANSTFVCCEDEQCTFFSYNVSLRVGRGNLQEYVGRSPSDLELVDDVISMKQFVADEAEGVAIAAVIQSEHVKRPIIDVLPKSCIQSQCLSSKYAK